MSHEFLSNHLRLFVGHESDQLSSCQQWLDLRSWASSRGGDTAPVCCETFCSLRTNANVLAIDDWESGGGRLLAGHAELSSANGRQAYDESHSGWKI